MRPKPVTATSTPTRRYNSINYVPIAIALGVIGILIPIITVLFYYLNKG